MYKMKNKKAFAVLFLVLFLVAGIATVMAQVCYFSDGVSVRWSGVVVTWSNDSDKRQNAFHKITFKDGTTLGPRNISVPSGGTTEKFGKYISNVEQCW
jgi:hypothetical protein